MTQNMRQRKALSLLKLGDLADRHLREEAAATLHSLVDHADKGWLREEDRDLHPFFAGIIFALWAEIVIIAICTGLYVLGKMLFF